MLKKKNVIVHLISLCILCFGFILCRYVFFDIHQMKQWPMILFIAGLFFWAISFFTKTKILSVFISFAYIIGFVVGVIFQTDSVDIGGAGTNNLWIIWTLVFACFIMIGIVIECIVIKKK